MSRRRRRKRAGTEGFNLSFLDAISCGFGAIVILLVLTKMGEPKALEQAQRDLEARIARLQEELYEIRGETNILNREMITREEQLSIEREQIARLRGDLSKIQGEFATSKQLSEVQEILEGRLLAAQQELSEEMKRLLGRNYRRPKQDATVGGIPVDSEYVIFVIDTSGSMYSNAWPLVVQKMSEVLAIYPKVKGIQVMNDMGKYMFGSYAGKWIPDTPSRRRVIVDRLRNWNAFSNSSPVEGVTPRHPQLRQGRQEDLDLRLRRRVHRRFDRGSPRRRRALQQERRSGKSTRARARHRLPHHLRRARRR